MIVPYCSEMRVIGQLCDMTDDDFLLPPEDATVNAGSKSIIRDVKFDTSHGPAQLIFTIGSPRSDGVHVVCTGRTNLDYVAKDYSLDEWAALGGTKPVATTLRAQPIKDRGFVLTPGALGAFEFGDAETAVVAGLTKELGRPFADDEFALSDCTDGLDRRVSWDGLSAYFANERLVGWSASEAAHGTSLKSGRGIGAGSTLRAARTAYGGAFHQTSSDIYTTEFSLGDPTREADVIHGSSQTEDGVIMDLWSGDSCDPGVGD
jgi:hypothetical protein